MARNKVRLNHGGINDLLKSESFKKLVNEAAERIASEVEAQHIRVGGFGGGVGEIDLPVRVTVTTTDRAHAQVSLAHPAGVAVQAKHGALTKAAAAVGLNVKGGGA